MAATETSQVDCGDKLSQQLARQTEVYINENPKSRAFNLDASDVLAGGTTRAILAQDPFPISFLGGRDAYLTSLDGHEYLDFVSEYCAGMFGHSHPQIAEAIRNIANDGFTLGGPTPKEGELAKLLVERFPSIDAIRFCNSGTEANTMAIATAIAYTGRKKVFVFEKGYHGGTLSFARFNPTNLPHNYAYGIYNDVERTKQRLDNEVGVIIVEPVQFAGGVVTGTREFLQFLRDEASRIGAVLIFDEVVTSRVYYGGMQEYYDITPDMTTLGKHFGGGFSFGAFGGKKHIMDLFDRRSPRAALYHSGTWNNNIFSMSAGVVATRLMSRDALFRTNALGDAVREGIKEIFASKKGLEVTVVGFGSVVGIRFAGPSGSEVGSLFYFYLLNKRIYVGHRGFLALNLMHTQDHVERLLTAVQSFADEIPSV